MEKYKQEKQKKLNFIPFVSYLRNFPARCSAKRRQKKQKFKIQIKNHKTRREIEGKSRKLKNTKENQKTIREYLRESKEKSN